MRKPIKNKSQLLYIQAKQLFERAYQKFNDGTIKSEANLIHEVFDAFQKFFTSMGKPNMVPRYAPETGPPWSEDYNEMMSEIRKDLELLFKEVDILGRALYSDFNHNMIQHEIIQKQFEETLSKMRDLEAYTKMDNLSLVYSRDDFLNKDKIDYSRISGIPLEIVDGAVTLPQLNRTNVAKHAKVTIIAGNRQKDKFILGTESNGFPGNNTEIHSVTDDVLTNRNYIPTFLGEENNHGDYSAVLDGSPNTWFEYEKVNVREHDKVRVAKNLGWEYQVYENQTITWAEDPDGGVLKLHMQIVLNKEAVINQINCNMYTPSNYNAKTAVVKNILVSDGVSVPVSVLPKNKDPDQYQFHFPPIKAKIISVIFEQSHKYITDIGHIFYEKRTETEDESEYAMDMANKKFKYASRVEGPLISLEDLGISVKVSDKSVEASYPLLSQGSQQFKSIGETINRLMTDVDVETVDMGIEKFEGFRWCIGVRDIEIFSCEYATEGELVTYPFYYDSPLDKISLDVKENIPPLLLANEEKKYDWLKYFVSIDDGATWHPITPISHQSDSNHPPKVYTIRTIESANQDLNSKEAYIESEYPVYSLRLKIIGKRPEDYSAEAFMMKDVSNSSDSSFALSSPILSSYLLNLEITKDASDSDESDSVPINIESRRTDKPDPGYEDNTPIPEPDDGSGGGATNTIKTIIANKKSEWCIGESFLVKGYVKSNKTVNKIELLINNQLIEEKKVSGLSPLFEFNIPENTFSEETITVLVRGHGEVGSSFDVDIINMIDCDNLRPEDKPTEKDHSKLNVVIDHKPPELCECDILSFYGSAQGPHPITNVMIYVNDQLIDPEYLGVPPKDDPCWNNDIEFQIQEVKNYTDMSDNDLLQIEDFGEWLEAYEEKHDCGCNKKKSNISSFQMQSGPVQTMNSEKFFRIDIPYWKLKEVGAKVNNQIKAEVIAYDTFNNVSKDSFNITVKDCKKPPTDENGNPRVRDCWELESIEVHYYNQETRSIEIKTIPAKTLPYEYIENGAGSGLIVGWNREKKGPILMVTKGYDQSGYAFQIHAVGAHYLNEYDQPGTIWSMEVIDYTESIKNINLMVGDPSRSYSWVQQIIESGDYSYSPSFGKINDHATFVFNNEWINYSCDPGIDFEVTQYLQPEEPIRNENDEQINECNTLTHIIFQVYDEKKRQLQMYKIDARLERKFIYSLETKNGLVEIAAGWVNYFNGPAIQIKSGSGMDNVLLTAIGVVYTDIYGDSQTAWSKTLRYKTFGVQYPEFILGEEKEIPMIDWILNGEVDYSHATYIGREGDMVAFLVDSSYTDGKCDTQNPMDKEVGITPDESFDVPEIHFLDAPEEICFEDEDIYISAEATDNVGLKQVTYGVLINGEYMYGPYTMQLDNEIQYKTDFPIIPQQLQIGDAISIHMEAINAFGVKSEKYIEVFVQTCDLEPPVIEEEIDLQEKAENTYCYQDLISSAIPLTFEATDDYYISGWEVSSGGWKQSEEETYEERTSTTGLIKINVPVEIPKTEKDQYERSYTPEKAFTIKISAWDKSGKSTEKTLNIKLIDCDYDPTPPHSVAKAEGELTIDTSITVSTGVDINMGNFIQEWTQWHIAEAGDWTTVVNAGRTELTNKVNQSGYSGWYNTEHLKETDFHFEMKYQARADDDDVLGAFFRVQERDGSVTGFYSIEHDGYGSWINGGGFRIIKHVVNGNTTEKTILAEDIDVGWEANSHRAYRMSVTIEGNKFTAELYGEEKRTRSTLEPATEPYNWVLLTALTAQDNSFTNGAWGPITNSNPHSYFWDLKMQGIETISPQEEQILRQRFKINSLKHFPTEDQGQYKDLQLTTVPVGEQMGGFVLSALSNQGLKLSQVIKVDYKISSSLLKNIKNNLISVNELKFVPSNGLTQQETSDEKAIIWGNVLADFL